MATEYVIRMLGLEVCADTQVGSASIRGVSGGQRKRVTLGEMLVSAKRVSRPTGSKRCMGQLPYPEQHSA